MFSLSRFPVLSMSVQLSRYLVPTWTRLVRKVGKSTTHTPRAKRLRAGPIGIKLDRRINLDPQSVLVKLRSKSPNCQFQGQGQRK